MMTPNYKQLAIFTLLLLGALLLVFARTQPARTQQGSGILYLPATMVHGLSRANITGKVYSAIDVNRNGIEDVEICIKHTGMCTISDFDGNYRFDDILAGSRIIIADELAPSTDYSAFERVVFLEPLIDNIIDIPLNPIILFEGGYRIVLSWKLTTDGHPVDLDANFWLAPGTNETPTGYHVTKYIDISNCKDEGSAGSGALINNYNFTWPYAYIDDDNTTGSDLETISIGRLELGKSTYAVLHAQYAGNQSGDYLPLADSNAVVELYDSSGLIASFQVPPSSDAKATWWHVFNIYDTGEIEIVNTIDGTFPVPESYTCTIVEE